MSLAQVTNIYYIIKSGDTLTSISKKFSTTIDQLLKWNPRITDPNKIFAGQEIKIGEKNIRPIIEPIAEPKTTIVDTTKTTIEEKPNLPEKIESKENGNFGIIGIVGIAALIFILGKRK